MQTRRKSLNLGDLGVIAPKRARIAHPSPPETVVEVPLGEPPVKKSKRSHGSESPPIQGLMSPPRTTVIRTRDNRPKPAADQLSPPPSPAAEGTTSSKVDIEGINDDIVIATIQQLERTGNRPHLVKELAAILATKLHAIEKSANPSALISSRLTAYLQRSWPAISPCPLAKDLSPVHPRRLYFYLTTTPHQPIPEQPEPFPKVNRIISPSLSSASAADEEDRMLRERQALSPSPEVDLSSPELDEGRCQAPPTPGGSFSGRNSIPPERSATFTHPRRAASPPLENEERDFKQTASALYEQAKARRDSQESQKDVDMDRDVSAGAQQDSDNVTMSIEADETEESLALKNTQAAADLFGSSAKMMSAHVMEFSSPMLQAQVGMRIETGDPLPDHQIALPDAVFQWDSLLSPEDIELDELDDMLDAY